MKILNERENNKTVEAFSIIYSFFFSPFRCDLMKYFNHTCRVRNFFFFFAKKKKYL